MHSYSPPPMRAIAHERENRSTAAESGSREIVAVPLLRWAAQFPSPERSVLLTIPGPGPVEREALLTVYLDPRYEAYRPDTIEDVLGAGTRAWITEGAVANFLGRVARMRVPPEARTTVDIPPVHEWELLWGLVRVGNLIVEEPLRSQVDHSTNLISEVHKALWEARFLDREGGPVRAFVATMSRWMTGADLSPDDLARLSEAGLRRRIERDEDRLDAACFVLTLAAQNAIVNRVVMSFDGVDEVSSPDDLRQLVGAIRVVDRWVRMGGCPLGLFIGTAVGKTELMRLQKLSPVLAQHIDAGMSWVK